MLVSRKNSRKFRHIFDRYRYDANGKAGRTIQYSWFAIFHSTSSNLVARYDPPPTSMEILRLIASSIRLRSGRNSREFRWWPTSSCAELLRVDVVTNFLMRWLPRVEVVTNFLVRRQSCRHRVEFLWVFLGLGTYTTKTWRRFSRTTQEEEDIAKVGLGGMHVFFAICCALYLCTKWERNFSSLICTCKKVECRYAIKLRIYVENYIVLMSVFC